MSEGRVRLEREDAVARIVFDRPAARNAMTKAMYADLADICARLAEDADVRVVVLRGAGGESFVAGSDIGIFTDFADGRDGVAYEAEMERHISALESLPMPTIAVIEGWAVGGGLNLAAACDLRIATPEARFGVPIARTIGNCLSMRNCARLVAGFGAARARRLLMLADFIDAEEARQAGFLLQVVPREDLEQVTQKLCRRILENAPLTLQVSKQAIARLQALDALPEAEDLIETAYGSKDFQAGVRAFLAREKPAWQGW